MIVGDVDVTLELGCWSDDLSAAQTSVFEKTQKEHTIFKEKLQELMSKNEGEEVISGELFSAYDFTGNVQLPEQQRPRVVAPTNMKTSDRLRKSLNKGPVKVGDVTITPTGGRSTKRKAAMVALPLFNVDDDDDYDLPASKRAATRKSVTSSKSPTTLPQSISVKSVKSTRSSSSSTKTTSEKTSATNFRPTEANSVGGLTVGIDIKPETSKYGPDSKEVTFSKLQGKTFPSLVVLARPSLRAREAPSGERSTLDTKVKNVLMLGAAKFTEWLIQQGLLKSAQRCVNHIRYELKLGVYSDASKFPHTGGYVWISECCPNRFVSVFSGSIFEGSPHPPTCILKLIYHWACQTNIQNVVQWVKVDNLYIKNVYTWLRAICTLSIQRHCSVRGGPGKYVEIGVISLGTTTQDGQQRQVKVEVLGVLDFSAKTIRLRAIEPCTGADRNYKKRFLKILEPLNDWVSKESTLCIDMSIDKPTLVSMGFKSIIQCASNDATTEHGNRGVMEYLRRTVPRMFQNTLSLLSKQMIQQFLDELVWRELFGTYPLQAFDNITAHIAECTKINTKETLIQKVLQVATNPFKDWRSSMVPITLPSPIPIQKKKSKLSGKDSPQSSSSANSERPKWIKLKPVKPAKEEIVTGSRRAQQSTKSSTVSKKQGTSNNSSSLKEYLNPKSRNQSVPSVSSFGRKGSRGFEETYYGTLQAFDLKQEVVPNFRVNCPICTKLCTSNIELQHDLCYHIDSNTSEVIQCRYCLEKFLTNDSLRKHEKTFHPDATRSVSMSSYFCLICQSRFSTLAILLAHMQKTHVILELPYKCFGCGYRTSSHLDIINHFHDAHNNANILQCPFCLKIFKVYESGSYAPENIGFYLSHIRDHADKTKNKRCHRCCLSFVDKGDLKFHQMNHHESFRKHKLVMKLVENSVQIEPPKVRGPQTKEIPYYRTVSKFDSLEIEVPNKVCLECGTEFGEENHITGIQKCIKCRYETCCLKAILNHTASCMGNVTGETSEKILLDQEMHCICGFSSSEGNALARHLAICESRSVYPSIEKAQENTVKRSMLDMLGLVRRDEDNPNEQGQSQKEDNLTTEEFDAPESEIMETEPTETTAVEPEPMETTTDEIDTPANINSSTEIQTTSNLGIGVTEVSGTASVDDFIEAANEY